MKAKLRVKQTRSVIGQAHGMRVTIKALGLRGPGSEVVTVQNTAVLSAARSKR